MKLWAVSSYLEQPGQTRRCGGGLLKELKDVGLRAVQVGGVDRLQVNDEV